MSFFCPIHVLLGSKRKENNVRGKFQRGISLGGSLATKRIATSIMKGVLRFAFYCLFSMSLRWLNTVFDTSVSFTFFSKTHDPPVAKNGNKQVTVLS